MTRPLAWRVALAVALIGLIWWAADTAKADVTASWAPMQLRSGERPRAAQLHRFTVVVATRPMPVRYWSYEKATRSPKATWPASWYLTQGGVRVRDSRYGSFVMNPYSAGWQRHVANTCPGRCFLDGAGTAAITRTTPRLGWSKAKWVAGIVSEIHTVTATDDRVAPNSVSLDSLAELAAAGRASTEAYRGLATNRLVTAGRVWVIIHSSQCGYRLASFLIARGKGDLFACLPLGGDPAGMLAPMSGSSVGKALAPPVRISGGWSRRFEAGTVRAYADGRYTLP